MEPRFRKLVLSALAGIIFYQGLMYFWAHFPNVNPFFHWLLSCCAGSPWFRPVVLVHDIFINVLLCLPLGLFLIALKPANLWLCAAMAIVPSYVLRSYHFLTPEYSGWHVSDFALGWAMELFSLPITIGALLIYRYEKDT